MSSPKVRRSLYLVTLVAGVAMGSALMGTAGADPAGPPGGLEVIEQNLDGDGYIAVHEQGVADVNVTNSSLGVVFPATQDVRVSNFPDPLSVSVGNTPLPVSGNVTADVSGSSVSLSSPVDVNGPVQVTGTVSVTGTGEGFELTTEDFILCTACVHSDGSTSSFPLDGVVTMVSLYSDRRADFQFAKDSDTVHTIFLQAGQSVNLTFPHPMEADHILVSCSTGSNCNMSYSIAGYTGNT